MQAHSPALVKEMAEFYRRGLMLGLLSVPDALAWLDRILLEQPAPDIALIEASLSGSQGPLAVADQLAQVPGFFSRQAVFRRLLGVMQMRFQQDRHQAKQIVRWLYELASNGDAPDEEAEGEIRRLEAMLSLTLYGGYGRMEDVEAELAAFLVRYAEQV